MMVAARRTLAALALVLASLAPALVAAGDVAGHWEGPIQLPGMELQVLVELKAGAADALEESIDAKDTAVSFAIRGVPGQPTFKGTLSADGKAIEGSFTQGGQTFPFRRA